MAPAQLKDPREATTQALGEALEPLVDLLLELGVTSVEAEDVLRSVYVRVAHAQIKRESPRASLSRIALKCGLYRSEVSRRLRSADGESAQDEAAPDQHRLDRLLTAWHTDPDFVTADGSPKKLPLKGVRSFEVLVSRYAANLYPAVVLEELCRVGAVRTSGASNVQVLARQYLANDLDSARIHEMGVQVQDILRTLIRKVRKPQGGSLAVSAMGFGISPEFLPLIRQVVRTRSLAFARLIDEELNDPKRKTRERGVRVGLYLVGVEEDAQAAESHTPRAGSRVVRGVARGGADATGPSKRKK
jgi:DNA-directed RNA polymerase specialized sigma24 family protein